MRRILTFLFPSRSVSISPSVKAALRVIQTDSTTVSIKRNSSSFKLIPKSFFFFSLSLPSFSVVRGIFFKITFADYGWSVEMQLTLVY